MTTQNWLDVAFIASLLTVGWIFWAASRPTRYRHTSLTVTRTYGFARSSTISVTGLSPSQAADWISVAMNEMPGSEAK